MYKYKLKCRLVFNNGTLSVIVNQRVLLIVQKTFYDFTVKERGYVKAASRKESLVYFRTSEKIPLNIIGIYERATNTRLWVDEKEIFGNFPMYIQSDNFNIDYINV